MAHIIPLHGDPHAPVQALLPWYANGTLDPDEAASVEAHLADCAECRAELEAERALALQIASLPIDAESGWASLRERMEQRPAAPLKLVRSGFFARPVPIGWAVAAQAAVLLLVVGITRMPAPQPTPYQALSAPAAVHTGNAIVIFRPETTEAELRELLQHSGARLVGGPTASNAWMLYVPAEERSAALAGLRATGKVLLAEPLDADGPR